MRIALNFIERHSCTLQPNKEWKGKKWWHLFAHKNLFSSYHFITLGDHDILIWSGPKGAALQITPKTLLRNCVGLKLWNNKWNNKCQTTDLDKAVFRNPEQELLTLIRPSMIWIANINRQILCWRKRSYCPDVTQSTMFLLILHIM